MSNIAIIKNVIAALEHVQDEDDFWDACGDANQNSQFEHKDYPPIQDLEQGYGKHLGDYVQRSVTFEAVRAACAGNISALALEVHQAIAAYLLARDKPQLDVDEDDCAMPFSMR